MPAAASPPPLLLPVSVTPELEPPLDPTPELDDPLLVPLLDADSCEPPLEPVPPVEGVDVELLPQPANPSTSPTTAPEQQRRNDVLAT